MTTRQMLEELERRFDALNHNNLLLVFPWKLHVYVLEDIYENDDDAFIIEIKPLHELYVECDRNFARYQGDKFVTEEQWEEENQLKEYYVNPCKISDEVNELIVRLLNAKIKKYSYQELCLSVDGKELYTIILDPMKLEWE